MLAGAADKNGLGTVVAWFALCLLLLASVNPSSSAADTVWPTTGWLTATPAEAGMDQALLEQARAYALAGGGAGFITRGGKLVMAWGDTQLRYDLKSTTKSIGVSALGLALQDGRVALDDAAQTHLPDIGLPPEANLATGWLDDITLRQLATHSAGFEKTGGFGALLDQPGTAWSYSDGGTNWLADVLTVKFGDDLNTVLFDRLFSPLGITAADLVWRNNAYRGDTINGIKRREFGSGISANVDAMARIGYLYLRGGSWDGAVILPQPFVDQARQFDVSILDLPVINPNAYFNAADHYGLLWWNNADGSLPGVPTDAYWSWGLGDSLIVVIPSLDIVVARAGNGWRSDWNSDYSVLEPFLQPIAESVTAVTGNRAPVANDDVFTVDEDSSANPLAVIGDNGQGSDSDPDLDPIAIIKVGTPDSGGSAVLNAANDALIYSPAAGFAGVETFMYTIADGNGGISTAAVSVRVGVANVPPSATPDVLVTSTGTAGSVDVLANDTNGGDGGMLSVTAFDATTSGGGVVECASFGLCTYTPGPGFSGSDSFTYTVSDAFDTAVATVTVTVAGGGYNQDGTGLVSMEAEHYEASAVAPDGHEWLPAGGSYPGYSGSDALRALPADNVLVKTGYAALSPRLDYPVTFAQTGTVYVWVRMLAPSGSSDTVHVGLDGVEVDSSRNIVAPTTGSYVWSSTQASGSRATMVVGTTGLHTVNVWMREAGAVIDKVVVTPDAAYNPATVNGGLGPDETRPAGVTVEAPVISPAGGVFANPVAVSLSTASEGATIRYTLDGSVPTAASTQYTAPFQVLFDTTVKARAFLDGYNDSAVSTAVFQIQALVPPTGLSDYWKLDETAGSTYTSAVDGNPAATCTACPAPVAGRIDGAQQFDGATDEVSVADNGAFDWPNGARLSIEAWIKRGSPCSVTGETVIGRRDASSLLEWSLGCQGINAAFRLVDTTGAGAGSDLVGTSDIADGNWHHVVAVRDAISGKNVLYVDGVEEASTAVNYAGDFAGSTDIDIGWLGQAGSDRHFAGSIDEIAIHERVLPDSEIRRHYADGAVGLQRGVWGCGAPVRIMPLGDSITRRWNPGYREGLYIDLIGAGMDIDMVGSMTDNCAPDCAHDPNHEGHSGYTASNIAGNVGTWLNLNPADVIMLHIGTNVDAGFPYPDVTAVGGVLDAIKAYDPDIPVVLARIINKARSSYDPQLSVFNQNLESLAQARVAAGDRILVVDQEPDLDYSGTTVDFAVGDDLHPTASGYAKMVPVWFEGLNRFMPACESVVPQVISTAPTAASIAVPYAYVVEATGVPAPGFSLTAAPAGMTIHPDTGRIDWLPQSAGSYGVTVRVTNIVGSSTQSFTIVVN